jgi:hypothetical protein
LWAAPTAVQALLDVHDTPKRVSPLCRAVGVYWSDQRVPSQRSAMLPTPLVPTAVQAVAEMHETPNNPMTPSLKALGLGVV